MYQIKGRVGRSERLAYAYLLYAKNKQMNEEATKRLKAIKEFAQLGSGYKIAMRDLSIRGSGDILGGEQAGFIDTVGFDMYMKILQEAIDEKTGEKKEEQEVLFHFEQRGYKTLWNVLTLIEGPKVTPFKTLKERVEKNRTEMQELDKSLEKDLESIVQGFYEKK
mgnify:CR=1 FL=1